MSVSRSSSPAAQLLRNSRLFSLPQALPRPITEQFVRDGNFRSSDSATTPYPTRQAIITPASSRHRGDWGLKRALPKRGADRSSEPTHGVVKNDTYESITEYHSASPHVKTLQRFQELNVAMSRRTNTGARTSTQVSAMDESLDFTDASMGGRRWKYAGNNVRGMTPAEFDKYLAEQVKGRKEEFMRMLRGRAHVEMLMKERDAEKVAMQNTSEEGAPAIDPVAFVAKSSFVDWLLRLQTMKGDVLTKYVMDGELGLAYTEGLEHHLRTNWWSKELANDSSPEGQQLRDLLQNAKRTSQTPLPQITRPPIGSNTSAAWLSLLTHTRRIESAFQPPHALEASEAYFATYLQTLRKDTTQQGLLNSLARSFLDMPPISAQEAQLPFNLRGSDLATSLSTHPTAGLSYLKTNKLLHNHPILGPQKADPPVSARYIGKSTQHGFYGVAGFVATGETAQLGAMSLTTPGGNKVDKIVKTAKVDGEGKILLELGPATDNEAKAVRDGNLERGAQAQVDMTRNQNLMRTLTRAASAKPKSRVEGFGSETLDVLTKLGKEMEAQRASGTAAENQGA